MSVKRVMILFPGLLLVLGVAGAAGAAQPGIPCELDYSMHGSR